MFVNEIFTWSLSLGKQTKHKVHTNKQHDFDGATRTQKGATSASYTHRYVKNACIIVCPCAVLHEHN